MAETPVQPAETEPIYIWNPDDPDDDPDYHMGLRVRPIDCDDHADWRYYGGKGEVTI